MIIIIITITYYAIKIMFKQKNMRTGARGAHELLCILEDCNIM